MAEPLAALLPRWRSAEQRLYPIILGDPAAYERFVTAARGVADELGGIKDPEALAAAYEDAVTLGGRQLEGVGTAPDPSTAELVAGAGFALRHRELVAELQAAGVVQCIAAAKAGGQRWVVLGEVSTVELAEYGQYRRLEMHLPDGGAVHAFAEPQIESDRPLYVVELLALDPATGVPAGAVEERLVFGDKARWQAAVEEVRDRLDTR